MRRAQTYFVYAGLDLKSRDEIVSRIAEAVPNLRLVDSDEQAELRMVYKRETRLIAALIEDDRGFGAVTKLDPDSVVRVLLYVGDASPKKFANGFIESYLKAQVPR